jgi:hypothetical protein
MRGLWVLLVAVHVAGAQQAPRAARTDSATGVDAGRRLSWRTPFGVASRQPFDWRLGRDAARPPATGIEVELDGVQGIHALAYDRVNGVSLEGGFLVSADTGRFEMQPSITYRSNLGAFDPGVDVAWHASERTAIELSAGRRTLTNDGWIRSALQNSVFTLAAGLDARNYYRANRAEARVRRRGVVWSGDWELLGWAQTERAWSVGPDPATVACDVPESLCGTADLIPHAWSAFRHDDRLSGMLRGNPRVDDGRISSVGMDGDWRWATDSAGAQAHVRLEAPVDAPGDARWLQLSAGGVFATPTFDGQHLRLEARAVLTAGDEAPPQRFASIGGSGTIPTASLLGSGGDQLLFLESDYGITVSRIVLGRAGSPEISARYVIGGADAEWLPTLTQNFGLRLRVSILRVDVMHDPASGRTSLGGGFAWGR